MVFVLVITHVFAFKKNLKHLLSINKYFICDFISLHKLPSGCIEACDSLIMLCLSCFTKALLAILQNKLMVGLILSHSF